MIIKDNIHKSAALRQRFCDIHAVCACQTVVCAKLIENKKIYVMIAVLDEKS